MAQEEKISTGLKLFIGCVGFNPASLLVAARHFQIDEAVLLASRTSEPQLEAVARQLDIPVHKLVFSQEIPTLNAITEKLVPILDSRREAQIILDVTGGTKLMAIGAWSSVQACAGTILSTYLKPNGVMINPQTGKKIRHEVAIEIAEVLAWQGTTANGAVWTGEIADIDRQILDREAVGITVLSAMAKKRAVFDVEKNMVRLKRTPLPESLPPSVHRLNDRTLGSDVKGYFSHNRWLEEICLIRAQAVLGDYPATRAALGLVLRTGSSNATNDEADVVLVRGSRICIIEAKARKVAGGAGGELHKRIQKTQRYFGELAHVIFVHPAWRDKPPSDLVDAAGTRATLIGSDIEALDRAILKALGLTYSPEAKPHEKAARPEAKGHLSDSAMNLLTTLKGQLQKSRG